MAKPDNKSQKAPLTAKFSPEQIENSRMLDSTEMEALYQVSKLPRLRDGTTVVRYHFSKTAEEANRLSMNGSQVQIGGTILADEFARKRVRETLKAVAAESGAKLVFKETSSLKNADVTFIKMAEKVKIGEDQATAYADTTNSGKSFIAFNPDAVPLATFRKVIDEQMTQASPEYRENVRKSFTEHYGSYEQGIMALFEEAQKRIIAHEMEHRLGAKHPYVLMRDEPNSKQVTLNSDPDVFMQSIMGILKADEGKMLGKLDVVWYQRHYGSIESPLPTPDTGKPAAKKETGR